jgi:ribonuclease HII
MKKSPKTLSFEKHPDKKILKSISIHQNTDLIVGVDEAGRGCLAGPVFSGAVCLISPSKIEAYRDSKQISEKKRKPIFSEIVTTQKHAVGVASVTEIEKLNILWASLLSMKRAVELLLLDLQSEISFKRVAVLIDGNKRIPDLGLSGIVIDQYPIVKGDQKTKVIAAASIVAKVTRDSWITSADKEHFHYGFKKNKGYGTKEHLLAIAKHGPSRIHRAKFKGVKEHWGRMREESP